MAKKQTGSSKSAAPRVGARVYYKTRSTESTGFIRSITDRGFVVFDENSKRDVSLPMSAKLTEISRNLSVSAVIQISCRLCRRAARTATFVDPKTAEDHFRARGWTNVRLAGDQQAAAATVLTVCGKCAKSLPADIWEEV